MTPAISIIVPVYNVEKYLRKCLESLVKQTLEEIEILVVNDGSPDDSQAIIDEYALNYPQKIKAFSKENGGLSDARNFALCHATGEYLAFVDSDDFADFDMFERMYEKAVETDSDVVCCGIAYCYENKVQKHFLDKEFFGGSLVENPCLLFSAKSYAWNKIYRRSFWEKNSFVFPVGQWFEDSALIYNVMLMANRVECVNLPMLNYNKTRDDSITNITFDERIFDIFKSCQSIVDFFKKQEVFKKLYKEIEYVCIKHIYLRIRSLLSSSDRMISRRFIRTAESFLNSSFPFWRESDFFKGKTFSKKIILAIKKRPCLMRAMLLFPGGTHLIGKVFNIVKKCFRKGISLFRTCLGVTARKKEEKKKEKRNAIQANGYSVLCILQDTLSKLKVPSFADFGTLLGLIREGKFLAHDLDIDTGAIVQCEEDKTRIRVSLERKGFRLFRQYIYKDTIEEESYLFKGVKIDINYYHISENCSKTMLFYKKPQRKYPKNTRNVVEMTYGSIGELISLYVEKEDCSILIPKNSEQLLEEKYGKNWHTPDMGWIYWKSPAATPLDETGYFLAYEYSGSVDFYSEEEFLQNNQQWLADNRELQLEEIRILREVKRVCELLDITYYLGEGSLLGALRHKGMIPWDNDIDILMPRADYERFLKEAPNIIENTFSVQHWTLTPNYWSAFIKVRLLAKSRFYQSSLEKITKNNGPYIDIFPLDSVPSLNSKKQDKQKRRFTAYRKALSYKKGDTRPKTRSTRALLPLSWFLSANSLYKKIDSCYHALEAENNQYWVNLASYYDVRKETFPISHYGTPRYVEFEGELFPVPSKAEDILKTIYGNYLCYPPQSKRRVAHSMSIRKDVEVPNEP